MSPPQQLRQRASNCSSLLIYRPQKDERLSWPSWLTYSRWFINISGHPSATGRVKDSDSTPAKDRRPTAGPRSQPNQPVLEMSHAPLRTSGLMYAGLPRWSRSRSRSPMRCLPRQKLVMVTRRVRVLSTMLPSFRSRCTMFFCARQTHVPCFQLH